MCLAGKRDDSQMMRTVLRRMELWSAQAADRDEVDWFVHVVDSGDVKG